MPQYRIGYRPSINAAAVQRPDTAHAHCSSVQRESPPPEPPGSSDYSDYTLPSPVPVSAAACSKRILLERNIAAASDFNFPLARISRRCAKPRYVRGTSLLCVCVCVCARSGQGRYGSCASLPGLLTASPLL
ncbi:hypothetical protein DPEC_G00087460 [Dallia pectoralis]|uniref:Uncharacterized protein n=1 Tax=Dallia pectoralis TaxID=75939 RepID=A0ACC2H0J5_DALPE|nr:hypothetical protein DPEC_G00087460 [Dallia pectoralis]